MYTPKKLSFCAAGCLAASLLALVSASAQEAPKNPAATAAQDEPITLSEFVVSSAPAKNYGASSAMSATRLNIPLKDVPQTISVITDKFIQDIGATDIIEAAAYTSGFAPRGPDPQSFVRGFLVTSVYKNLVLQPVAVHPDLAAVQSVEIIKGPASAIAGRGNAGGLVNYTTKKPVVGRTFGSMGVIFGSDSYKKVEFDYNTPLVPYGDKLTARFIGALTDANHYRDPGKIERFSLYPSMTWTITPKTQLMVELESVDDRKPANTGQTYNNLTRQWTPFDFSFSEEFAREKNKVLGATATFVHVFNDIFSYRQIAGATNYDHQLKWIYADALKQADATVPQFSAGDYYLTRHVEDKTDTDRGRVLQGDLLAKYSFANGFVNNRTLLSYDYNTVNALSHATNYSLTPISLSAPIHGSLPYNPVVGDPGTRIEGKTSSYLISHQTSVWHDRIEGIYGWRRDRNDGTSFTNVVSGATFKAASSSLASQRYGIVIKPVPSISLYYLYSDNAEPTQTVLHFPGIAVDDPRQSRIVVDTDGEMHEFGLKGEFLDGRVSVALARFKLQQYGGIFTTQFGPAQNDPATAGLLENVVNPSDTSEGWELEFNGSLVERLTFLGTYYNTDTKRVLSGIVRGFRGVPEETATLFLNYSFADAKHQGLDLHAGVRWQSSQWADVNNTYKFDAAYKVDVGLSYRLNKWVARLNVNNVTNQLVPTQPNAFRYNTILPPREIRVSFTQNF